MRAICAEWHSDWADRGGYGGPPSMPGWKKAAQRKLLSDRNGGRLVSKADTCLEIRSGPAWVHPVDETVDKFRPQNEANAKAVRQMRRFPSDCYQRRPS